MSYEVRDALEALEYSKDRLVNIESAGRCPYSLAHTKAAIALLEQVKAEIELSELFQTRAIAESSNYGAFTHDCHD